jgi:small multidrug resistance pump
MRSSLILAGVYNLAWGLWVVLFPNAFWALVRLPAPNYPPIWQCVGMMVGVYGVGYLAAAREPLRHWPVVLVGFLGKIFGPIGFVAAACNDGSKGT